MPVLSTKNLGLRAGGKWVVWDVDLEIEAGQIVGLYGRSGSGKTSLARLIAGLIEPTSGTLTLPRVSLAQSSPAYAPELTCHENLAMFAALWGIAGKKRTNQISFLLELTGLADERASRAGRLAAGELARLELARALLADAPLVIIDSLLDRLDSDVFQRVWEHLLALRRDQMASFLIATSSPKVAGTCPKIAVIHRGRISFIGRPEDFRRLAGEDMIVLGDMGSPLVKSRIQDHLSVVIKEEDGFLSFRVANGERVMGDLLSEFGSELGCVYLKRPTLEDALDVMATGSPAVAADAAGRTAG